MEPSAVASANADAGAQTQFAASANDAWIS
jgi:hypothetical protein